MGMPCGVCKSGHFLQESRRWTVKIAAREGTTFLPSDLPSKGIAGIQPTGRIAIGNSPIDQALGRKRLLGDD